MKVYVVGAGEYEQWGVHHVAASLDAAVKAVLASYAEYGVVLADNPAPPRPCKWADDRWYYTVTILEQNGYKLTHPMDSDYDITEYELAE